MNNNFDYNYTNNNPGTNNKYLNEENYQKGKKKITIVAGIVLVIGLIIGGGLIAIGLIKQGEVNSKYSDESRVNIEEKISIERKKLENKKAELKAKGIKEGYSYEDGEAYDLHIITNVLNPSFGYCNFDEYKNNTLTSEYCLLTQQLDNFTDFNKDFDSFDSIPFFMFGAFVIIASCMISGSIFMIAKRREITAFTVQQHMPVAQEAMEQMAPNIANVTNTITEKTAPTIANAVGDIGKELAKGITEGINQANQNNENK